MAPRTSLACILTGPSRSAPDSDFIFLDGTLNQVASGLDRSSGGGAITVCVFPCSLSLAPEKAPLTQALSPFRVLAWAAERKLCPVNAGRDGRPHLLDGELR